MTPTRPQPFRPASAQGLRGLAAATALESLALVNFRSGGASFDPPMRELLGRLTRLRTLDLPENFAISDEVLYEASFGRDGLQVRDRLTGTHRNELAAGVLAKWWPWLADETNCEGGGCKKGSRARGMRVPHVSHGEFP
jgi:hypothetical protein